MSARTSEAETEGGVEETKTRLQQLMAWWKQTRVARGLARYGAANGALLTGGIAYSGLFSIFAALTVGFSIFAAVLGSNTELQEAVLDALNSALPGIVQTDDNPNGLLSQQSLEFPPKSSVFVAVIAFVVLLNSATSVMSALRAGIRAMFGIVMPAEKAVLAKLRDLLGFFVMALAVIATGGLGIVVGAAGSAVIRAIGLEGNPAAAFSLRLAGFLVALVVDFVVVIFLIRGLAGARAPRRDLLIGALVVAVAAGVIRYLGTSVVSGSVSANPLLSGFATIIVLLLWVNFIVRILLMVCAWTANPPEVPTIDPDDVTHADGKPNYVTESDPETLSWDHDPQTGRIRPEPPPPPDDEYWGGLIGWVKRKWRGFREA